jgi:putative phosphoesterase
MGSLLGILSDSHSQVERTRRAIELLQQAGATEFIHCGDVEIEQVLDLFAGLHAHVTFGNCDPAGVLARYAAAIDLDARHPSGEVIVDGRRVAFTHGDSQRVVSSVLADRPDFLLHGHTHERRDDMVHGVRVINPGALHRARPFTVALLEPATGALRWLEVA